MTAQLSLLEAAPRLPPQDFGDKGKRCWLWMNTGWWSGRAWSVDRDGNVIGRARDYGDWSVPYPGSMPCEAHGRWSPDEVAWTRPPNQYDRAVS